MERKRRRKKAVIYVFTFMLFTTFTLWGCRTCPDGRSKIGNGDYVRPESIEAGNYALTERIGVLERQIRIAREEVRELRESCERIISSGGRSADLIQGIIEKMETLILWINWASERLYYLENILQLY